MRHIGCRVWARAPHIKDIVVVDVFAASVLLYSFLCRSWLYVVVLRGLALLGE